jgi:proteasome inhibitor subunit 1 (PI31)
MICYRPGSGMFVGPDHPMFQGEQRSRPGPFAGPGPERLPPGAVPPGARFDPISPFGPMPGRGINRPGQG